MDRAVREWRQALGPALSIGVVVVLFVAMVAFVLTFFYYDVDAAPSDRMRQVQRIYALTRMARAESNRAIWTYPVRCTEPGVVDEALGFHLVRAHLEAALAELQKLEPEVQIEDFWRRGVVITVWEE